MIRVPLDQLVPDFIQDFEAYIPSPPDEVLMGMYGTNRLYRLNNNENPLGPPLGAREALRAMDPVRAAVYPSGDAYQLRKVLGEYLGLDPQQILVGNGANEVIAFVIKAFCREGDNIVTGDKTFAVYEWVARFSGFEARLAPLKDFGFDEEGMWERTDRRTKILFLCNPNNPTGTYWNHQQLVRFLDAVDGRHIVVVDEAYAEFVEAEDYPNGIELIRNYPNLVVFRTFSKMFGLAGLRIGYLAGSREVVDIIRKTCVVYSVNTYAQLAAQAALSDAGHIRATRKTIREGKAFLVPRLEAMNLTVVNGEGNFVMVRLPMSDTWAYRKLMTHGVMVRSMTGFRFPNWIRVSIATLPALEALVEALKLILKETP